MKLIVVLAATSIALSACEFDGKPKLDDLHGIYMHIGNFEGQPRIIIEPDGVYRFISGDIRWSGIWSYRDGELDVKFCKLDVDYNLCPPEKKEFDTLDPFVRGGKTFLRFNIDEKDVYQKLIH